MTTTVDPSMVTGGAATVDMIAALRGLFVGKSFILPYAPTSSEPWFIPADGRLLVPANYPLLFQRYGTIYGGNGSTTFGVPDYRGRTIVGVDNMGGVAANRLTSVVAGFDARLVGAAGGTQGVQLTVGQLPKHKATGTTGPGTPHQHEVGTALISSSGAASTYPIFGGIDSVGTTFEDDHTHAFESNEIGNNETHINIQPSMAQFICILAY